MKYDVFISHSNKDESVATRICEYLEQNDIKCWIAPRDVAGELAYEREIVNGIDESQILLLVFSANSNLSHHVESEINRAVDMEKTIIPFRIDDSPMSDSLSNYLEKCYHIIDGFPLSDDALTHLKESIITYLPGKCSKKDCAGGDVYAILARKYDLTVEEVKRILADALEKGEIFESSLISSFDELLENSLKSPDGVKETKSPLSNEWGVRGSYSILQNAEGEILIMMDARVGEPKDPRFLYDGTDVALLYRSQKSSVAFRNIDEPAHEPLKKVSEILVVEISGDDVIREYMVPVRLVKDVNSFIIRS